MQLSEDGLFFLARHEGIVPGPYKDSVGVWTYGIGHAETSGRAPNPKGMARGMPSDLDDELRKVIDVFIADMEVYARAVRRAVTVPMEQHEFDAAVSFHYNTGAIARATWVKHWNAGDKATAKRSIMSWRRPPEIVGRRTAERDLWASGDYGAGKAHVWHVSDSGVVRYSRPVRSLTKAEFMTLLRARATPGPVRAAPVVAAPAAPPSGLARALRAILRRLFRGAA